MFRLDINMKRLDSIPGRIFLITHFLNFDNRISWESTPRGELQDPYLWSCLLDTKDMADEFLAKLDPYVFAQKVSSKSAPGKFRVGISLYSLDKIGDARINLSEIYFEKLTSLIQFLQSRVEGLNKDWMKFCYLKDMDTFLPILAVEFPGVSLDLMKPDAHYNECKLIISQIFEALLESANINQEEAIKLRSTFNNCFYGDIQKDRSYAMLDFPIVPSLLRIVDIAKKKHIRMTTSLFFSRSPFNFPAEIGTIIAEVGGLTSEDADALSSLMPNKSDVQEPQHKVIRN